MNNDDVHTPDLLDRLIAALLAVFSAPLCVVLAALREGAAVKVRFARALRLCAQKGWALRYDGEDDATVAARVRYIAWIAADPWAARRRMVRGLRGWEAHRYAHCMPVLGLPARAMGCALADARVFESPLPDTS